MEPWALENGGGEIEFNIGAKAAVVARNISPVYGDNAIGDKRQENDFLILRKIDLTLQDTGRLWQCLNTVEAVPLSSFSAGIMCF